MGNKRYPEEFRIEAAKQVTERRYPVAEVASTRSIGSCEPKGCVHKLATVVVRDVTASQLS